jgi:hypothetical protein
VTTRPRPADALPQPGWRLVGVASIGLGSGLYTADMPFEVMALAFAPTMIAMAVIAVKATLVPEIAEPTDPRPEVGISQRR